MATETKEEKPQNVSEAPPSYKGLEPPKGGWQEALWNIATKIEANANDVSNQDDRLHALHLAQAFKEEVGVKPTEHATKGGK
jgi:hypothetical protein